MKEKAYYENVNVKNEVIAQASGTASGFLQTVFHWH